MKRPLWGLTETLTGAVLAAALFYSAGFAAGLLLDSELYGKSRVLSMIAAQDTVGVTELVSDRRNVDIALKFAAALTSAYIDFELIPIGEAGAFAAIFESLPDQVEVTRFEYRRKNLVITGTAPDSERYDAFLSALRETGRFAYVYGSHYESDDGVLRFELECLPGAAEETLPFSRSEPSEV